MSYIYSNELYHHGIKGQKWGERRWQNTDGSLTAEGYPHYGYKGPRGESFKSVFKGKQTKEDISQLSDAELRERTNRLRLENEYRQKQQESERLSKDPYKIDWKQIGKDAVQQYGKQILTAAMIAGTVYVGKKVFEDSELLNTTMKLLLNPSGVNDYSKLFSNQPKEDLSKYSDSELQQLVKRKTMETQYRKNS